MNGNYFVEEKRLEEKCNINECEKYARKLFFHFSHNIGCFFRIVYKCFCDLLQQRGQDNFTFILPSLCSIQKYV